MLPRNRKAQVSLSSDTLDSFQTMLLKNLIHFTLSNNTFLLRLLLGLDDVEHLPVKSLRCSPYNNMLEHAN